MIIVCKLCASVCAYVIALYIYSLFKPTETQEGQQFFFPLAPRTAAPNRKASVDRNRQVRAAPNRNTRTPDMSVSDNTPNPRLLNVNNARQQTVCIIMERGYQIMCHVHQIWVYLILRITNCK